MKTMTITCWRVLLPALLCLAQLACLAQTGPAPEPPARRAALPHPYLFFRGPDLVEAKLSPSGRLLAVTTRRGGVRVGLYVFDLANGAKVTRLAQFKEVDVWNIHWASDERLLFSAVDYSSGSGSPEGAPGLFAIDVQGGSPTELIERESSIVDDGSRQRKLDVNHHLLWVPDAEPSADGERVLIARLRSGGPGLPPLISPLWLNVRTGRAQRGDLSVPGGTQELLTDSRGQPRVAMTLDGRRQTLHWRGPQDDNWRALATGDLLDMPFTPRWVDDQGHLYVQWRDAAGYLVFGLYDFERKAPAAEPLVRIQGFDFQGEVVADGGRVLGVRIDHDAETTIWFDPALKNLQAAVDLRLPGKVNRISCRRCDKPDAVVLVRSFSDRDPGRLLIYRPQPPAGQPIMLTVGPVMPGIDPARMAQRDFRRIQARDGRELPVWITRPAGQPQGLPAPAVVLVHGGPWVRGGSWQWDEMSQFLASRGYLVLEPEFRGSTGYGEAHFRAGWKQWGQAMQDDVADALRWAREQKLADERACIAGASYGGYSALMGLVRHPELYRCGIAWAAVTDLELLVEGSWWVRDDAGELARRYSLPEMVGDPKKDAALLIANSPLRQAAHIKAPVLLAFGEADLRVPLAHGKRLREALTAAGNPPEWVSYPGEGHGFVLVQNRLDFALRMERFLATQLAPR